MKVLRYLLLFCLIVLSNSSSLPAAEPCQKIHGRARLYTGDGQLFIWHIGTRHEFWIEDDPSWDLIFKYIPNGGGKDLFADFTVCPTRPFRKGAAQPATVKEIRNPHLVPVQ
ncbi:MAG: hypothetical protein ABSA85_09665 [Terracidiphilus sp.]|jgi:hypothetical protein